MTNVQAVTGGTLPTNTTTVAIGGSWSTSPTDLPAGQVAGQTVPGGGAYLPAAAQNPAAVQQFASDLQTAIVQVTNYIKLAELRQKMAAAPDFDAKNKIFHEYWDPEPDQNMKLALWFQFMGDIPKEDADRVMRFLEAQPK